MGRTALPRCTGGARQNERVRHSHAERERQRDRETERQRDRETERQRDRESRVLSMLCSLSLRVYDSLFAGHMDGSVTGHSGLVQTSISNAKLPWHFGPTLSLSPSHPPFLLSPSASLCHSVSLSVSLSVQVHQRQCYSAAAVAGRPHGRWRAGAGTLSRSLALSLSRSLSLSP